MPKLIVWIILFITLNFVIRQITDIVKALKGLDSYSKEREKILKDLEKLKKSYNSYEKWYKINKATRDKIIKIKSLADRGVEGEQRNAVIKLNNLLNKNGLKISDIPK